ncbi:MAG TPA: LacI family DNA-binding transcriptional regulator [Roseiflexaceae bacterium]|nr:LacI family DNA-binding transcriptional regulator [Roseiflexaceae bacterium]
MPATLSDIARHAGVSLATASRVLNGSNRGVTPVLRDRVLLAARELEYVPNAHAQALVKARSSMIGVIVHDVSDPYFSEIVRGIQRVVSDAGQLVMICNSYRDPARELEYLALLRSQRVQAIVMAGSGLEDAAYHQQFRNHIDSFVRAGGRAAFIGRHNISGDAGIPDNRGGAREVARVLLSFGHRRIGVISGPELITSTRDRLDGFVEGLCEAGITLPPHQIVTADFSRDGGEAATHILLDQAPDLTAIFALNDTMAIGALAALRARDRAVPECISLVGFDDIPMMRDLTPALSTVHVPMMALGARAIEMALDEHHTTPRVEYLPTEMILRASTALVHER